MRDGWFMSHTPESSSISCSFPCCFRLTDSRSFDLSRSIYLLICYSRSQKLGLTLLLINFWESTHFFLSFRPFQAQLCEISQGHLFPAISCAAIHSFYSLPILQHATFLASADHIRPWLSAYPLMPSWGFRCTSLSDDCFQPLIVPINWR